MSARRRGGAVPRLLLGLVLGLAMGPLRVGAGESGPAGPAHSEASGRELMQAVYRRHRNYPYVYEEQSMVLIDAAGQRQTRRLRRYSSREANGDLRILLHFRYPRELQGVALVATLRADGTSDAAVFLPALGPWLIANGMLDHTDGTISDDRFLGTDFSIESLIGENLEHYRYERREDVRIGETEHHVVDVFPKAPQDAGRAPLRRHFIAADVLFVTRTDHFDPAGRLRKRLTHHDLVPVHGDTWRANMMLMDDRREQHRTIVKIDRRIFSPDYVPPEVFTPEWILANAPPLPARGDPAGEGAGDDTARDPDAAEPGAASRPADDAGARP